MEASAGHESGDLALSNERFPRSNRYDPKWILDDQMGLNPLWLTDKPRYIEEHMTPQFNDVVTR